MGGRACGPVAYPGEVLCWRCEDDKACNNNARLITYVSDVEGHWDYFCNFVELSQGIRFQYDCNYRQARSSEELKLVLEDDWHFVFGGDAGDKGPGTLRFLQAMVMLKEEYPSRVHLILGNRDINKIRWTAELADSEIERVSKVPAAFWLPERSRLTALQYLTKLAAREEGVDATMVTEEMIKERNTKANRLRYLLDTDMGSAGDFEFRRQELAHLNEIEPENVSDEAVVESYEASLREGGLMSRYLFCAQLGVLLGPSLFVHGQIIGTGFPKEQVRGADDTGLAWSIGVVPDDDAFIDDVREWLRRLNSWAMGQLFAWRRNPTWAKPPEESTYEEWQGRAGADLIAYGTPGTRVPTVVYCRYLTHASMPLQYPPELVTYLKDNGVAYVVVGHTPHGNTPTVIQHDGLTVIMGDTSFSHMKADKYYKGDNRGAAVTAMNFVDDVCRVHGFTESEQLVEYKVGPNVGDKFVGMMQRGDHLTKRFFVKARIPDLKMSKGSRNARNSSIFEASYIMVNIDSFKYDYALVRHEEVAHTLGGWPLASVTQQKLMGCGYGFSTDGDDLMTLLEYVFRDADVSETGRCSKKDLITICSDKVVIDAVHMCQSNLDVGNVVMHLDEDLDATVSLDEFQSLFMPNTFCASVSESNRMGGILFELVDDAADSVEQGDFPRRLGPFDVIETSGIKPSDLSIYSSEFHMWHTHGRQFILKECAFRTPVLKKVLHAVSSGVANKRLRGHMSPLFPIVIRASQRLKAHIPENAEYFVWSYGVVGIDWTTVFSDVGESNSDDPDLRFLSKGAFIYFDGAREPIKMTSLLPAASDGSWSFGAPKRLEPCDVDSLISSGQVHPTTLRDFMKAGATHFCWVTPWEDPIEGSVQTSVPLCKLGGFAYFGHGLHQVDLSV
eukprot:TRINITY_DN24981_c0_g1_i1.p1 TRINITY_DN24981_c0_g1~~TRINITY_DN24981_c0_g1_i1.p1  ORF type:complete len:899 (+),score=142.92 TRINITY_DN24981_c0_g1_i1:123-2819(+)